MPGDYSKLDKALAKANLKFDRVRIARRGHKFSLRATLPPKPGESKPRQRYLPTGKPAVEAGLKYAISRAMQLESDLIRDAFRWADWSEKVAEEEAPKAVSDWAEEIIRAKSAQVNGESLKSDYIVPYSRLPQGEALTEELCRRIIEEITEPHSRNRQRYVVSYIQLCRVAGIKESLRNLLPVGGVPSRPIDVDDLPTDDQIIETWAKIKNPAYQILFARMACYGLRPHESFRCQVSQSPEEPFCKIADGTKTGSRLALPWPIDWYQEMQPWLDFAPHLRADSPWQGHTNRKLGNMISTWFWRNKSTVPFNAYALRHRYACRLAENNVADSRAAEWMGHSITVHVDIYQQALGMRGQLEAWRNAMSKT